MDDLFDDIICIGHVEGGGEVNVYYAGPRQQPIVEILNQGRVGFKLAQMQSLLDLLGEALEHWHEEGES